MRRVSRKPNKTNRRDRTSHLHVRRAPGRKAGARVAIAGRVLRAAIGPSGINALKREGDGATPRGAFALRRIVYRADRGPRPASPLPTRPIRVNDGWCEAPGDRNYNRPVPFPYSASAERLWRDDRLYDLVLVLGANDRPRKRGCGSAIFIHVARDGLAPTEGCIAFDKHDLRWLLAHISRHTRVLVTG